MVVSLNEITATSHYLSKFSAAQGEHRSDTLVEKIPYTEIGTVNFAYEHYTHSLHSWTSNINISINGMWIDGRLLYDNIAVSHTMVQIMIPERVTFLIEFNLSFILSELLR